MVALAVERRAFRQIRRKASAYAWLAFANCVALSFLWVGAHAAVGRVNEYSRSAEPGLALALLNPAILGIVIMGWSFLSVVQRSASIALERESSAGMAVGSILYDRQLRGITVSVAALTTFANGSTLLVGAIAAVCAGVPQRWLFSVIVTLNLVAWAGSRAVIGTTVTRSILAREPLTEAWRSERVTGQRLVSMVSRARPAIAATLVS